jgi:hypothetical protein
MSQYFDPPLPLSSDIAKPSPPLEHDILYREPQIMVSFLAGARIFLNVLLGFYTVK